METNEIEKENLEKKIENRNGIKAPIRKNNIVKKLIIKNFGKYYLDLYSN